MEMCYDGTLVMPSSYALMDEEEMCYIEGGGIGQHWFNKISFVAAFIDVGITLYFGISGAVAAKNASKFLKKMAGKTCRKWMIRRLQRYIGSAAARLFTCAVDVAFIISGSTLGSIIANAMNRIDGNREDEFIFA